jgi:hypothetical protein
VTLHLISLATYITYEHCLGAHLLLLFCLLQELCYGYLLILKVDAYAMQSSCQSLLSLMHYVWVVW